MPYRRREEHGNVIFSWICSLMVSSCLLFDLVVPKGQLLSVPTEGDGEMLVLKPEVQVSISSSLMARCLRPTAAWSLQSCLLPEARFPTASLRSRPGRACPREGASSVVGVTAGASPGPFPHAVPTQSAGGRKCASGHPSFPSPGCSSLGSPWL